MGLTRLIPAMSESTAQDIMSSPVKTVLSTATIQETQQVLLRYGHAGLGVVSANGQLVGMVSRKDIDVSVRHGLGHRPVTGCMSTQLKTALPETSITDIQSLMATYDMGRIPVLTATGDLVGIVTRTDLLRQLQIQSQEPAFSHSSAPPLPTAGHLYQQLSLRVSEIWPAMMLLATTAEQRGWSLYLVGGGVRDLLLSLSGQPHPLTDIDLVVEGAEDEGAGVLLAQAIQARYPQVDLQTYGQFQTASLIWPAANKDKQHPEALPHDNRQPWLLDIATARTEFYAYPAANPAVESSMIRQDLYRRDFTINAMALRLNGKHPGQLLDFFGGWSDLHQQCVRVLHTNSFIEDPTRIFRAVRFATRLGFELEAHTQQLVHCALSSGIYDQMNASDYKTPALQSRLQAELKYLLEGDWWDVALSRVDALGALACVHRDLSMTPALWQQMHRMHRWLYKLGEKQQITQPRWLMLLLLLLAQLESPKSYETAQRLHLDKKSQQHLKTLHQSESALLDKLSHSPLPSDTYECLQRYAQSELLLMAARYPYALGPQVWHYIVHLSRMPPLINGGTLKRLGFRPGPQFREILTSVHRLTLNGELTSTQLAEAYVLENYS